MSKNILVTSIVVLLACGVVSQVEAQSMTTNVNTNVNSSLLRGHDSVGASTSISVGAGKMADVKTKSDGAIDSRITKLNDLNAKVQAMAKVPASTKNSLSTDIQTSTTNLANLKAKINADTDGSILTTDAESITAGFRIYALVIPQGYILVAGDKAQTVAASMSALSTKLQARIAAAQSAGNNVSSAQSAYADFSSKISDSNTHASAAISSTASLSPDNGNTSVEASNKQALENARADVRTSVSDLRTAYADAKSIVKDIEGYKVQASSTVSTSATVVQ